MWKIDTFVSQFVITLKDLEMQNGNSPLQQIDKSFRFNSQDVPNMSEGNINKWKNIETFKLFKTNFPLEIVEPFET